MSRNKSINNIALIGFSTTGKTLVASKVAGLLNWDFIDIDDEIVKMAGKSIPDIFVQDGETEFRRWESQLLQQACNRSNVVIATGGGAILSSENRNKLSESCFIVCLEASIETIHQRLLSDTAYSENPVERPLLSGEDQLNQIKELKSSRQILYSMADWTVHTDNLTIDEVAQEVIKGWSYFSQANSQIKIGQSDLACMVNTSSGQYPVFVEPGLIDKLGEKMKQAGLPGTVIIISDLNVSKIYGNQIKTALEKSGFLVHSYFVPPGETSKNIQEVLKIWDFLIQKRIERKDSIVALGGGMIGDMAGFVAATYLRGIPLIHVPTTLISMTDASIGGKVAVDHSRGKNLIGAFYQPKLVLIDTKTLSSMPERELRSGWAEVIKHGLILDRDFFELLESNAGDLMELKSEITSKVIARSAGIKAMVVSQDEKETGIRTLLNFGHTVAHGLEAATSYNTYFHGEAVAIGMVAAAKLSHQLGFIAEDAVTRITEILLNFKLPINFSGIDINKILEAMEFDKKVRNKTINWVLLKDIGQAMIYSDVPLKEVNKAIKGVLKS